MSQSRRRTAAEILARIEADPQKRAARDKRQRERAEREAAARAEEHPILDELERSGLTAPSSLWTLSRAEQVRALPILVKHLSVDHPRSLREGIARALNVPEARAFWKDLLGAYRREQDKEVRWALACALSTAASDSEFDDLLALLDDSSAANDHSALLTALVRSGDPRAKPTLQRLSEQIAVAHEAKKALRALERRQANKTRPAEAPIADSNPLNEERASLEAEVSTSVDTPALRPLLERLAALVGGFGPTEIARVMDLSESLELDEESGLTFRVILAGKGVPLRIHLFADDVDSVGIFFFGTQQLINRIRSVVE